MDKECFENDIKNVMDMSLKEIDEKANLSVYEEYAKKISVPTQFERLKDARSRFKERTPLHVYLTIGEAKKEKGMISFDLRYRGQSVAKIKVGRDSDAVMLRVDKDHAEHNRNFSDNTMQSDIITNPLETDWNSKTAERFRSYFKLNPERYSEKKKNEEHRIESQLLSEFSKKCGKNKSIIYIQPIKIAGCRFPMTTAVSASKVWKEGSIKAGNGKGGGIDILARTRKGNQNYLTVIEVKDENKNNEPPEAAVCQASAYAAFLQRLLRSKGGQIWWNLFGMSGNLPESLVIRIVCAMPKNNESASFAAICKSMDRLPIGDSRDLVEVHAIFFDKNVNPVIHTFY